MQIFSSDSLFGTKEDPSYISSYLSPSFCKRLEPKKNQSGHVEFEVQTEPLTRSETGMGVGKT